MRAVELADQAENTFGLIHTEHFKRKILVPYDDRKPATSRLILAFAAIYLIWGTTYLAMRIAVETIPPFMVGSSRFLIAGSLTFLFLRVTGTPAPSWQQWRSAALIGILLMVGGNGLVMWAVQRIPSGIAALVVATMPLWMTVLDWLFYGGPKPTARVALGLILGIAGSFLLLAPANLFGSGQSFHLPSMIVLMLAPIFWSIGSLQARRIDLPKNVFMTTSMEALCGGTVLALMSFAFDEPSRLLITPVSARSIGATIYLAIFGSLIALTSYCWLMENANAARVSTYAFVNPVIAVVLGWLILNEQISLQTSIAIALIVVAVVLIVLRKKPLANH